MGPRLLLALLLSVLSLGLWPHSAPAQADPNARWASDFGMPGVSRGLSARWIDASIEFEGKLILGGLFEGAGGLRSDYLIGYDDGVWSKVGNVPWPGLQTDAANSLAIHGGLLHAGGYYRAAGTTERHVAVLQNGDWGNLPGIFEKNGGQSATIHHLHSVQGDLFAAGDFDRLDGVAVSGVARWDGTQWNTTAAPFVSPVFDAQVVNGEFYVSAALTTPVGDEVEAVFRWNGTGWSQLGPGFPQIQALGSFNGELVMSFHGDVANVTAWNWMRRWNGTSWRDIPSPPVDRVSELGDYGTELWAAGNAGLSSDVYAWNGSNWSVVATELSGLSVNFGTMQGQPILFGGFRDIDDVGVGCVVEQQGGTWTALDSGLGLEAEWTGLNGLLPSAQGLVVTSRDGCATDARSYGTNATWDGSDWIYEIIKPTGVSGNGYVQTLIPWQGGRMAAIEMTAGAFDPTVFVSERNDNLPGGWVSRGEFTRNGAGATVVALIPWNGNLLAVGGFDHVDGVPMAGVAEWDGVAWSQFGSDPGFPIKEALAWQGDLVVASEAGGVPWIWNGTAWNQLPAVSVTIDNVAAMEIFQNDLIVSFDTNPNIWLNDGPLLRWDNSSWTTIATEIDRRVHDMIVFENELILAGEFFDIDGQPFDRVARWQGVSWNSLGEGIEPDRIPAHVQALAIYEEDLWLAGEFVRAGGKPSYNIARWNASGGPTAVPRVAISGIQVKQVVPNPFNPRTTVHFQLSVAGPVEATLYDLRGREIWNRDLGDRPAGENTLRWDGLDRRQREVASGTYLLELRSGADQAQARLTLVR